MTLVLLPYIERYNSANHSGCFDFSINNSLLHKDLVTDSFLHLLLTFALSDHHIVLSNLLHHLATLYLTASFLHYLFLEK